MADVVPVFAPTRVERFERIVPGSSTSPAIVTTDSGRAYVKVIENAEGPHALAREWVGTRLAAWFGLPTLDTAIFGHDGIVDIVLPCGTVAGAGPVFGSREAAGRPWGGSPEELDFLVNGGDITRLVVFDTWVRNHDRYWVSSDYTTRRDNKDNVFLTGEGVEDDKRSRLLAIDHTHAFTRGDLDGKMNRIDVVRDQSVYGLFPEFRQHLSHKVLEDAVSRLDEVSGAVVEPMVAEVPAAWEVGLKAREAWVELVCRRAAYVADTIPALLSPYLPIRNLFGSTDTEPHDA